MAEDVGLPEGFVLDKKQDLPEGFVLDKPQAPQKSNPILDALKFAVKPAVSAQQLMQSPQFKQAASNTPMTNIMGVPFPDVVPSSVIPQQFKQQGAADTISGMTSPLGALGMIGMAGESEIGQAVAKLTKPVVAQTLSMFSNVHPDKIMKALDHPELLSGGALSKERKIVNDNYKNIVEPTIKNLKNTIDTTKGSLPKTLDEIKDGFSIEGEPTRQSTTMTDLERNTITNWLNNIKGNISLNKLDATIADMDTELESAYRAKTTPTSKYKPGTFEVLTSKIRGALRSTRDEQYPDLQPHFERMSTLKSAEDTFKAFNKIRPSFYGGAATIGMLMRFGIHPQEFIPALATSPRVQAFGIKTTSDLLKAISGGAKSGMEYTASQVGQQEQKSQ